MQRVSAKRNAAEMDIAVSAADLEGKTSEEKLLIAESKLEAPNMSKLESVSKVKNINSVGRKASKQKEDPVRFWMERRAVRPTFVAIFFAVVLIQPSSGAVERAFSVLKRLFNHQQDSAYKDYVLTSVMLEYNDRLELVTSTCRDVIRNDLTIHLHFLEFVKKPKIQTELGSFYKPNEPTE